MTKRISLDQDTQSWIADRVENEDPLCWPQFIVFLRDLGVETELLQKYRSVEYRERVREVYEVHKQKYNRFPNC